MTTADMAIVPAAPGNAPFVTLAGATFPVKVPPRRVLTDQLFAMRDLYPDTYQTMTETPEAYDVSQLTTCTGMFLDCSALTTVDLAEFIHSGLTNDDGVLGMFQNCSALTAVDFTNVDTSAVRSFAMMFNMCTNLTTVTGVIDCSSVRMFDKISPFKMMFWCTTGSRVTEVTLKNVPEDMVPYATAQEMRFSGTVNILNTI